MITANDDIGNSDFLGGTLLLIDKPQGWTSFDVVNKLRWAIRNLLKIKKIKVGHSGTLDPMATGLLMICTGKWTKQLHELQGLPKQYTGTITLGGETASYDKETEIVEKYSLENMTCDDVEGSMKEFLGDILQVPPMFSAIKVKGKPLYKLARKGESMTLEPRPVSIRRFDMTNCELPEVDFVVDCSKGTYVRSMAHDLGQKLGCGGYLSALRRTRVGDYKIEDAWKLDKLITAFESEINVRDKQNTMI